MLPLLRIIFRSRFFLWGTVTGTYWQLDMTDFLNRFLSSTFKNYFVLFRTLPGRGHQRPLPALLAPPSSSSRRLPAGVGGSIQPPPPQQQQQVYQQDLAYYDIGVSAAVVRQQQQQEGGNTSRVMEWMLDVERQNSSQQLQQQQLPADLRSQSSKGAVKTSPRFETLNSSTALPRIDLVLIFKFIDTAYQN